MANNSSLIEVKDRGWLNGFGPLWRKQSHAWWGSWSWLVKIILWIGITDGMLAGVTLAEAGKPGESVLQTGLMIYFIFAAMIPAMAVIIFGHEDIIDERKMGTAAWVLSKPVSRAAFLLSKLAADALGVLATMVLVQGVVAYFIFKAAAGVWLSIPRFLAGLGLISLFLIFYLALILMLGTLFRSRGPVIGIPMVLISSGYLTVLDPWLAKFMPSSLILTIGSEQISLAEILLRGQPLPTVMPILSTGLLVILFIIVALVRFRREEF